MHRTLQIAQKRGAILKNDSRELPMKSWILISVFFSFSALACPTLVGEYKICRVISSSKNTPATSIKVEQKITNKFHNFIFTITDQDGEKRTENYFADGKMKTITNTDSETGIVVKTRTTAICNDQNLIVQTDATIDNEPLANMTVTMSKNGTQMTQIFQGESMGEVINDTVVCD
jgi:YD repeat-containing protein